MTDNINPDWINPKGHKVPDAMVSEADKLTEEVIRSVRRHGEDLMARIARYRGHSFDDIDALRELLGEKYGLKRGGAKGNISFTSFDGCTKVEVRVQDHVAFGPELQIAKGLIDEYIDEVSEGVADELRVLLTRAFETDKPGYVNRGALQEMRRWPITHPTWRSAMEAIADSIRVVGSKEFFVIAVRDTPRDGWKALPINLANAYEPETAGVTL